jgi:hypothetical protein
MVSVHSRASRVAALFLSVPLARGGQPRLIAGDVTRLTEGAPGMNRVASPLAGAWHVHCGTPPLLEAAHISLSHCVCDFLRRRLVGCTYLTSARTRPDINRGAAVVPGISRCRAAF